MKCLVYSSQCLACHECSHWPWLTSLNSAPAFMAQSCSLLPTCSECWPGLRERRTAHLVTCPPANPYYVIICSSTFRGDSEGERKTAKRGHWQQCLVSSALAQQGRVYEPRVSYSDNGVWQTSKGSTAAGGRFLPRAAGAPGGSGQLSGQRLCPAGEGPR